jgi:CRISPR-associated protein Csy2
MSKYLTIPRIEFTNANAQPAWWCVAAPGPSAFAGLAHALARAAGLSNQYNPIATVWHDWDLRAETPSGWMVHPHQFRSASLINGDDYAQGSKTLSGQPTVRGDGAVSLLLELEDEERVDLNQVDDFLRRARIAGGSIVEHRFDPSGSHIYDSWSDAKQAILTGFTLQPRPDLLAASDENDKRDPLDRFLDATRRMKVTAAEKRIRAEEEPAANSWLTPYVAGWLSVTDSSHRNLTREGAAHAFAEPLIGLGQYVSLRKAAPCFFRYTRIDPRTVVLESSTPERKVVTPT